MTSLIQNFTYVALLVLFAIELEAFGKAVLFSVCWLKFKRVSQATGKLVEVDEPLSLKHRFLMLQGRYLMTSPLLHEVSRRLLGIKPEWKTSTSMGLAFVVFAACAVTQVVEPRAALGLSLWAGVVCFASMQFRNFLQARTAQDNQLEMLKG